MTYLLDTNVVSELRKPAADRRVVAWASALGKRDAFLSVVTIRELEAGVLLVERRDAEQGFRLRAWFEQSVLAGYADRILPVDLAVARRAAVLHVPDPRPERDALIAATALVHGFAVATRNVADFAPTGVRIVDPWA
ncbi:type II toxin-antitoxin system VapC family toxin [Nocardioides sp. BYT-33-1]|uniref:type II toxin-antitoxin system VapC family toxin n=1 Tax=Nocardioides sp. BYT-33-1 TaxID=3416952 RepID=UPI003F536CBB